MPVHSAHLVLTGNARLHAPLAVWMDGGVFVPGTDVAIALASLAVATILWKSGRGQFHRSRQSLTIAAMVVVCFGILHALSVAAAAFPGLGVVRVILAVGL